MSYLVHLGLASLALQIDLLFDTGLPEYVVTSSYTLLETQPTQQLTKIVESDVRIGCSSEYASQKIVVLSHHTRLQQLCDLA